VRGASAPLPCDTAAVSGAVLMPCSDGDLERYEVLIREAEDFGEAW